MLGKYLCTDHNKSYWTVPSRDLLLYIPKYDGNSYIEIDTPWDTLLMFKYEEDLAALLIYGFAK